MLLSGVRVVQAGRSRLNMRPIDFSNSATAGARRHIAAGITTLLILAIVEMAWAGEDEQKPLHERVDALITAGNVVEVAGDARDLEFLRRVHLDLTGCIPTSAEAREFAADADPDKRAKKVDALLDSREFALHMATTFDHWVMERRSDQHVKNQDWRAFLVKSFEKNMPYNVLVAEILSNDGADPATRAAARFYLDRLGEPHVISRDVGRIFFGKDLQCAQCHDHPNIDSYLQQDYHGLFAFYTRTSLFHPDTKKPSALTEKAEGEATYESVFTKVKGTASPRFPGGNPLDDPESEGDAYKVAPNPKDKNVRPVPAYSRRERLARMLAEGDTGAAFNRNIANRLWAHLMGRGLVEPVDFHHAGNPPSHPGLLDLLARSFAEGGYDIRAFLRELALTRTYQRAFEMPGTLEALGKEVAPRVSELTSDHEAVRAALIRAADVRETAKESWEKAALAYEPFAEKVRVAEKKRDEARAAEKKAIGELSKAKAGVDTKRKAVQALESSEASAKEAFELLPDDKALAGAVGEVTKRKEAVAALAKKAEEGIAGHEEKLIKATESVAASEKELADERAIAETERAQVAELENAFNDAHERYLAEQSALKHVERLANDARELVAYSELTEEQAAADAQADAVLNQTEEQRQSFQELEQRQLHLSLAAHRVREALRLHSDPELKQAVSLLESRRNTLREEYLLAAETVAELEVRADEAREEQRQSSEKTDAALESLTKRWSNAFAVGVFAPLTPEQLCLGTARATGQLERHLVAGRAEFDKKLAEQAKAEDASAEQAEPKKEEEEKKKDAKPAPPPLKPEERDQYVESYLEDKLKGALGRYIRLFGGQAGQPQTEFYATADQALFLANDGLVRGWLSPSDGTLVHRLRQTEDPAQVAEELYLSILTRLPEPAETQKVAAYLAARPKERVPALQELAWALLSSVEFRFRH